MKKLLRFEFHNMLRQKIVYVTLFIMLIFLSLLNQTSDARLEYYKTIGYGIEDMIVGALTSCFFTSFMAVIISFVVCRDYEQGIIKNVYAKGYTREKVYFAKFIFIMLISTCAYLITVGLACIQAVMIFGKENTDIFMIMFAQYIAILAYSAFDYMICNIFSKNGFSIAFLVLIPPIGGLLLDVIDSYIPFNISLGDLWITQTMSYIHGGTITNKEIVLSLITSLIYIAASYAIGLKVVRSR